MKSASLAEIRKELKMRHPDEVLELCARLLRHRKENKELLHYLLFGMNDEQAYVNSIKEELKEVMAATNISSFYLAKKTIRKALRTVNRYTAYSDQPETELDIRLFFLEELCGTGLPLERSKVIKNLYDRQLLRIDVLFHTLHEDLQFDFSERFEKLR